MSNSPDGIQITLFTYKKNFIKTTCLFVNTSAMITDKKKVYNNVVPKKNTHICRY